MISPIKYIALALALVILAPQPAQAGQKVAQEHRVALQLALMEYVDSKTFEGRFLHFDAERKELLGFWASTPPTSIR